MAIKRKGSEAKYVFRRIIMVIMVIGLLVCGSVYFGYMMAEKRSQATVVPAENVSVSSVSEVESVSESESEADESDSSDIEEEEQKPVKMNPDVWNLRLVNKQNELPEDFEVELVKIVDEFRVDKRVEEPLLKMLAGAREDGISLQICSAYRSKEYQTELFDRKKNELVSNGMKEADAVAVTATIITNPGTSEHQTGLAVDIITPEYQSLDDGFENTPAFLWLSQNAEKYGYILRYPKDKQEITEIIYEPWHYRYVGVEAAMEINSLGMCLEEYIAMLKENDDIDEPMDDADEESEATDGDDE